MTGITIWQRGGHEKSDMIDIGLPSVGECLVGFAVCIANIESLQIMLGLWFTIADRGEGCIIYYQSSHPSHQSQNDAMVHPDIPVHRGVVSTGISGTWRECLLYSFVDS